MKWMVQKHFFMRIKGLQQSAPFMISELIDNLMSFLSCRNEFIYLINNKRAAG